MQLSDVLSLLTRQHDEIEALLVEVTVADVMPMRASALAELADKLTLHLALEQELLYPATVGIVSDEVRDEMLAEHMEIKRVLADLIWLEREDQRFARKLVALQVLLQWHEAWQEGELFPRIAAGLPARRHAELAHDVSTWLQNTQLAA
jgi:hypothetical protein